MLQEVSVVGCFLISVIILPLPKKILWDLLLRDSHALQLHLQAVPYGNFSVHKTHLALPGERDPDLLDLLSLG